MGKIKVKIDDEIYSNFKNFVCKEYGKSKEILNKKINEAIDKWLEEREYIKTAE